jgi:predicted RND superfamily exporter protein
LLLAWVALGLRPDDRLSDSQPSGSEAYQALAHCDDVFGGTETVEVRVAWPTYRAADSAEVMRAIQDARQVLAAEPLVHNQVSINDFLDQFPGGNHAFSRPGYLALLPEAILEVYLNKHTRRAAITGRIRDLGIATHEPVFSRIDRALAELNDKYPGYYFQLTGNPVGRGRQLYIIVVDLAKSLGTASVIILLVLTLVYRSFTIGLITIVPNMFPLAVTATYLVTLGRPLEIASVCSFTVCLGIAVDDSIHFLTRYQDERVSGKSPSAAVRSAFIGVGTALITTTLVLIAGFATVLSSDLPGHRTFASMACWTIGAALIGDLVFLPALLLCFDRTDPRQSRIPRCPRG